MAEGMTHSESKHTSHSIVEDKTPPRQRPGDIQEQTSATAPCLQAASIWTPRFITVFALTFVLGLSATSLLTQGYSNHYFAGETILLIGCALVFTTWLTVAIVARSPWARLGGIFGCCWALFASMDFVASLLLAPPGAAITAHTTAAANLALFACYLCFSINRTSLGRWDHWFLRLAPVIAAVVIIASYIFAPAATRSVHGLEGTVAITTLYLSIFTWWLRPSCWRQQPGAALLLGTAAVLLLLPPALYAFNDETGFSYLQVSLVFFLLGALRMLQAELRQRVILQIASD